MGQLGGGVSAPCTFKQCDTSASFGIFVGLDQGPEPKRRGLKRNDLKRESPFEHDVTFVTLVGGAQSRGRLRRTRNSTVYHAVDSSMSVMAERSSSPFPEVPST
jgi:hypothetical protein